MFDFLAKQFVYFYLFINLINIYKRVNANLILLLRLRALS